MRRISKSSASESRCANANCRAFAFRSLCLQLDLAYNSRMSAEPLAFLNGELLPYSQAKLSLHDAGFVFGATVTDFCRTFRHQLFRWADHLARFRKNCSSCFIPLSFSDEQITSIADELIAHNSKLFGENDELALISFATPGEIGYFIGKPSGAGDSLPTIGMHTIVLNRGRYRRFFADRVDLIAWRYEAEWPFLPPVKHRSRMHWWCAENYFRKLSDMSEGTRPKAVPIIESERHGLLETAIGSFLLVRDGMVCSPERLRILDGISLRVVEELCASLNIPFAELDLTHEYNYWAREAMLTGSAFCLASVRSIMNSAHPFPTFNQPGPIFERLLNAFSDLVGVDIRADFLRFP